MQHANHLTRCKSVHMCDMTHSYVRHDSLKRFTLGRGWVFFERTRILSGIRFARHFIEFVFVETKQCASSNANVILTRQTCGQRWNMSAGSNHRALAFYFSVQNLLYVPNIKM